MTEWLDEIRSYVDAGLLLGEILAAILAVGVTVYVLQSLGSLFRPIATAFRWLFGVRSDRPPSDLSQGVAIGLRMTAWTAILAALLLLCFGRAEVAAWFGGQQFASTAEVEETNESP
jgi:hypothetical protein